MSYARVRDERRAGREKGKNREGQEERRARREKSKKRKENKKSRRECNPPPPLNWRFANSKIYSHELDRVLLRSGFGTTRQCLKSNPDHGIDESYPTTT